MQKAIVLCLIAALAMTVQGQWYGGYGYGGYGAYYPSYYGGYGYAYPSAYYGGYGYPYGYASYGLYGKKKREAGEAPQEAAIEMNPRFQPFAQKAEQA